MQPGTYALTANPGYPGPGGADYIINSDTFNTDNTHTGSITITSINTSAQTYSASYQFQAVDRSGTVVTITNGMVTNSNY